MKPDEIAVNQEAKLAGPKPSLRRSTSAVCLFASSLIAPALAADVGCLTGGVEVRGVEVIDARALKLGDGRLLRIVGIEPFDLLVPETTGAKTRFMERLTEILSRKNDRLAVLLTSEEPDRYGHYPALITADGKLLQETLAGEGLGIAYAGGAPLPCFDRILAAEDAARRSSRGFWEGEALPSANPNLLQERIGHFTIFEGEVLSVGHRGRRSYLDFGRRWSEDVTVEVEAGDRVHFGGEAGLTALVGHTVRVRGYLQAKAGPMMAIRSTMQLELLD
jgi:endonuclease YncB( thermonuclease family)